MKTRVGLDIADDVGEDDVGDNVWRVVKRLLESNRFMAGSPCCTRERAKGVSKAAGVRLVWKHCVMVVGKLQR